ncbi:MAG: hypothetical protein F6K23_38305, partial [Okeania sp. SIO2C9]|uniref:hypothetical protein n=1 Tax=Okeania sp. SIO2C9 TaxID=2607791 RepID=UPI0013C299EB
LVAINSGSVAVNLGSNVNLVAINPGSKSSLLLVRGFLIAGRYIYQVGDDVVVSAIASSPQALRLTNYRQCI